jgi:hypothetical protein
LYAARASTAKAGSANPEAVRRFEFRDLRFELGAHRHHLGAHLRGEIAHELHHRPLAFQIVLVDVGHIEDRLHAHQAEAGDHLGLVLRELQLPQRLFRFKMRLAFADHLAAGDGVLVAALGAALGLLQRGVKRLDVGEHQFDFHHFDVRQRIDAAFHVDDVRIVEATNNLQDRIDLADVAEEGVPLAFTLARAAHDARDVHQFQRGGDDLLRGYVLADAGEPVVRHRHDAFVRLDRAERIVRALRVLRLRECVEQGALPDVRQTDDSRFHVCESRRIEPQINTDGTRMKRRNNPNPLSSVSIRVYPWLRN